MNITKEEAIKRVGKAIAVSQYHDEMGGGYGLSGISAESTLAAIFGGNYTDYKEDVDKVRKEHKDKMWAEHRKSIKY